MKKRRKLKKSVIIILIVFIIAIIFILFLMLNKNINMNIELIKSSIEINSDVYNVDLIKVENGTIINEKEKIDTSKLGTQEIKFRVKDNSNKESEQKYSINIVDTIKPVIEFNNYLSVEEQGKIDLLKDVKATDNSNEEIIVKVEGDYDLNKVGKYELYYVAKDSSGNEVKEKFTLEVTVKNQKDNKQEEQKQEESPQKEQQDNTFTTSKGFSGYTKNGITYIDGLMIVNKTYSLPESYNPGDLDTKVKNAAKQMFDAAKSEKSFNIWDQSGFRSYKKQSDLYNRYVNNYGKDSADTFSARPGHSEHQTGLAFDVCATNKPCINSDFDNTAEAKWLASNAYRFGFILRFPKGKENETGYMYESWHFRYIGDNDLAKKLYNNGDWITLEDYFGITSKYN